MFPRLSWSSGRSCKARPSTATSWTAEHMLRENNITPRFITSSGAMNEPEEKCYVNISKRAFISMSNILHNGHVNKLFLLCTWVVYISSANYFVTCFTDNNTIHYCVLKYLPEKKLQGQGWIWRASTTCLHTPPPKGPILLWLSKATTTTSTRIHCKLTTYKLGYITINSMQCVWWS